MSEIVQRLLSVSFCVRNSLTVSSPCLSKFNATRICTNSNGILNFSWFVKALNSC